METWLEKNLLTSWLVPWGLGLRALASCSISRVLEPILASWQAASQLSLRPNSNRVSRVNLSRQSRNWCPRTLVTSHSLNHVQRERVITDMNTRGRVTGGGCPRECLPTILLCLLHEWSLVMKTYVWISVSLSLFPCLSHTQRHALTPFDHLNSTSLKRFIQNFFSLILNLFHIKVPKCIFY